MKGLLSRIYLKIYFSFLLIFLVTVFAVVLLSSGFYASKVHEELEGYFLSNVRFLQNEYWEACGDGARSMTCEHFFRRLDHYPQLHVWIVDRGGKVLLSREPVPPPVRPGEMERALLGETVTTLHRRSPPRVISPIRDSDGKVQQLLVLERSFFGDRPFPRFPFFLSLAIAGFVIAILVLPLSLKLTKPLRELHHMAQEWSEGRLEQRAQLRGNDEISDLAGVFNTMAENLQKMLQQRKEFLALISHELKSPLARMKIALQLLLEGAVETEKAKLITNIETDIAESEKLVEQLLLLSRVEMNIPIASFQPLDLHAVVEHAWSQIIPIAESAQIRLQRDTLKQPTFILGDPLLLQRAIANILENAVKFSSPSGSVLVAITRQDGRAILKSTDQGSGIQPDEVERIFEPFYRGKGQKKEGAGLGLFLARRIIEIHGGKITAIPNQPNGTVIMVEFPLIEAS